MVLLIGIVEAIMYQSVGREIPACKGELLPGAALRRGDSDR